MDSKPHYVEFSGGALSTSVSVVAEDGEALLDIVRRMGLPLYWRCGHGTCGACAVKMKHSAQPRKFVMSRKERNVLIRHGFLSKATLYQDEFMDTPELWRLACYLYAGDELSDLKIWLPPVV